MKLSKKLLRLGSLAVLILFSPQISADDKGKIETEQIAKIPADIKIAQSPDSKTLQPALASVFFFETGTNFNLQSVKAGVKFDMVIFLNSTSTSDVQVTVKPFRLDVSGLGSGIVKVIPIVVGTQTGEKYWGVAPSSPITVKSGNAGVRVRGIYVQPNAKQPPEGNVTKPFEDIVFPDQVIMFVQMGDVTLTPTLRVTKP